MLFTVGKSPFLQQLLFYTQIHLRVRWRKRLFTFSTIVGVLVTLTSLFIITKTVNYALNPTYQIKDGYQQFGISAKQPKFNLYVEQDVNNKKYVEAFREILEKRKKPSWDYKMHICSNCKKLVYTNICNSVDLSLSIYVGFERKGKYSYKTVVNATYSKNYDIVLPFFNLMAYETLLIVEKKNDYKKLQEVLPYSMETDIEFVSYAFPTEDGSILETTKQKVVSSASVLIYCIVCVFAAFLLFLYECKILCSFKESFYLDFLFRSGMSGCCVWIPNIIFSCIQAVIFSLLTVLIIEGQSTTENIIPSQNRAMLFFYFFFFCLNIAAISFLMTIIIRKHIFVTLVAIGVGMFFGAIALLNFLAFNEEGMYGIRDFFLILPVTHASEVVISALEGKDLSSYSQNSFTVCAIFPLILFTIVCYLDNILTNGNGLKLKFNYVSKRKYWFQDEEITTQDLITTNEDDNRLCLNDKYIESPPPLHSVLNLHNICKTYVSTVGCLCKKMQINAVQNFTACFFENQITCLLGHNGAGKSSLISILIGKEVATKGKATIDGIDITDSIIRLGIRKKMGICEQFDCFCPYLTLTENIEMTYASKSILVGDKERQEMNKLLVDLELEELKDSLAIDLSGGQKRKLSTIMALVGKPRIVYLDEPTSGMDPVARRCLWQVLQNYKKKRAIVLSTHFMDEADIVSERKVFMSAGRVMCSGSSMFLKNVFNCGTVVNYSAEYPKVRDVIFNKLRTICAQLVEKRTEGKEKEFQIPVSAHKTLPDIVKCLEAFCKEKTCISFGLSQPTLDDVFLKLTELEDSEIPAHESNKQEDDCRVAFSTNNHKNGNENDSNSKLGARCESSFSTQFIAQFFMSLHRLRRRRMKLASRIVLPICLIVLLSLSGYLNNFLQSILKKQFNPAIDYDYSFYVLYHKINTVKKQESYNKWEMIKPIFFTISDENSKRPSDELIRKDILNFVKPQEVTLEKFLLDNRYRIQNDLIDKLKNESPNFINVMKAADKLFIYLDDWSRTKLNLVSFGKITYSNQITELGGEAMFPVFDIFENVFPELFKTQVESVVLFPYEKQFLVDLRVTFFLLLMAVMPVSYLSDPIEDRQSKVRDQLTAMGLSPISYWMSTLLLHWIQYAGFFIISVAVITFIMGVSYLNSSFLLIIFTAILFVGIPGNLIFLYFLGSMFEKPQASLTILLFFIQIGTAIGSIAMQLNLQFLLIFPWFWPPFASIQIVYVASKLTVWLISNSRAAEQSDFTAVLLNHPYFISAYTAMFVHTILFSILLYINEYSIVSKMIAKWSSKAKNKGDVYRESRTNSQLDYGVLTELERLEKNNKTDIVIAQNVSKKYNDETVALKCVNFGAGPLEVLALLGPSGAGKTTTLSLTVGEQKLSGGTLHIRTVGTAELLTGEDAARVGAIGYCPQHNPLFNEVTVEEHIRFYAKIRGVVSEDFEHHVEGLIKHLSLTPHRAKQSCQLSGGNKRRLCLAIALLGNPSAVVVDEASTGVDPGTMRSIWNSIRGIVSKTRTVLITTHSMEEVEALASRVAIIHRGKMVAFGTVQELKSRFGQTYTLEVLLDFTEQELQIKSVVRKKKLHVLKCISEKFKQVKLLENLLSTLQFEIPNSEIPVLSDVLFWLAQNKTFLQIQHFGMYQASLDQIFVSLIRFEDKQYNDIGNEDKKIELENDDYE